MRQETEKIVVLVRATPEESKKHGYLVCVAGINEEGEFRRVYPFEFSYGEKLINFKKKDRIEVVLTEPDNDQRRESRKQIRYKNLHSPVEDEELRNLLRSKVSSIEKLTEENASLGVVKPELLDVKIDINSTEIYDKQQYFNLMGDYLVEKREKVKMPVELRYHFRCKNDPACKGHQIILLDWELNELARNVMRIDTDPASIEEKIRYKFFDSMQERDLYFVMGTHFRFKTWMIIGIFYLKKKDEKQKNIFDF
ncbi:TPA: hypothetical protein HA338_07950 [Methanosarcina acetivorans]|uniref:Uncharacterized protein n=2 Tax=Methanosarcina acetivorans TaxID=2214 RepID=Q8TL84_METAC|nr:hypothetical protein [Methanosarcina acetivorans]AAM06528.1 predicted protein [Methanosarcina acetivorans C2A]HIH93963.1 hypothetical protein [Methanosarcina acetivorans]